MQRLMTIALLFLLIAVPAAFAAEQVDDGSLLRLLRAKGLLTDEDMEAVKKAPALEISGELRFRPEMRDNSDFKSSADDKQAYTGQRIRLGIGATLDDNIKALVEIQDVRKWGEKAGNVDSSTEKEALDLYQAYFQLSNIGGLPIDLKIGRQALVYGDQRLIGALGWADTARSFDAYKASYRHALGQVDLFLAKLKETASKPSNSFNDDDLNGLYTMWKLGGGRALDVYYMIWKTDASRSVNTYGLRYAAKTGGFDYTLEAVWQGGKWTSTVDQSANAFALTAGYTFADLWGGSRLGLEYDFGSGDEDPADGTHKTFVFPFHTNHGHYGYMDYFSWGNMKDLKAVFKGKPGNGPVSAEIAYHKFELDKAQDAWLNVVGTGTFLAAAGTSTDAGQEVDLTVAYPYAKNLNITAGYSLFLPGQAAKDRSGGSDTSTWGYVMLDLTF